MKNVLRVALFLLCLVLCLCLTPTAFADVPIDETHFPNSALREYILEEIDRDGDSKLDDREIARTDYISLDSSDDLVNTSLQGIEYFTELEALICENMHLTELDVSSNTDLMVLYCNDNQLSGLDVSKNERLIYLNCSNNRMETLDVSKNPDLLYLLCPSNRLTSLNLGQNPDLVLLNCSSNQLEALDVSNNRNLWYILCDNNKLKTLSFTNNPKLSKLYCSSNQLTRLNIRQNPNLYVLDCGNNPLASLDIRACPCLLTCHGSFSSQNVDGCIEYRFEEVPGYPPPPGAFPYYLISYPNMRGIFRYDASARLITSPSSGLILPDSLTEIDAEAFSGGVFSYVILPEGVNSIGSRAFAACPNLLCIYIPKSTDIDSDIFGGKSNITIYGASPSTAEQFAADNRYTFIYQENWYYLF